MLRHRRRDRAEHRIAAGLPELADGAVRPADPRARAASSASRGIRSSPASALLAIGHALLAGRLIGTVFFAGLAPSPWSAPGTGPQAAGAPRLARTPTISPQPRRCRSPPSWPAGSAGLARAALVGLAIGVGGALALRTWHDAIFADRGAWFIAAVLVGALIAGVNAWRRARRQTRLRRLPRSRPRRTGRTGLTVVTAT